MSETLTKEVIKTVTDNVNVDLSKSYASCCEWCIELSDTLIIVPRNSWCMDVIAVRVTSGTVQGTYVPESWSAPKGVLQSDAGRCLYFNSPTNEWLFSPLSTNDSPSSTNNSNNNSNNNSASNSNNNSNNNSRSNSNSYTSSPASPSDPYTTTNTNTATTSPTKTMKNIYTDMRGTNVLEESATAASLEALISLNYSADFDYDDDSDGNSGSRNGSRNRNRNGNRMEGRGGEGRGGDREMGNAREQEGEQGGDWDIESAKHSSRSIASSLFHSLDGLDDGDGMFAVQNMNDNDTLSGGESNVMRTRTGEGEGEGEGKGGEGKGEGNELNLTVKAYSESSRSQRSRLSSNDAEDQYFDTFEDLPSSPSHPSPFPSRPTLPLSPFITQSSLRSIQGIQGLPSDEFKEVKKAAAVRFSIPASTENSASVTPRLEAVALALSAVSRIVITLRHTDVFVSLAGPLQDLTLDAEQEVFDETRLFSNVSHKSAVFHTEHDENDDDEVGVNGKNNYDNRNAGRTKETEHYKTNINAFQSDNRTTYGYYSREKERERERVKENNKTLNKDGDDIQR